MFGKTHIARLLSVILIMLIACDIAGFVLWQTTRAISYRYVRHHRQSIAMRDTLTIPTSVWHDGKAIVWHKGDEIAYGGEMFDIKKQYTRGNDVVLIGHYDKFENKLFKLLYKMLNGNDEHNNKQANTIPWHFDAVIPTLSKLIKQLTDVILLRFALPIANQLPGYTIRLYSPPDVCA